MSKPVPTYVHTIMADGVEVKLLTAGRTFPPLHQSPRRKHHAGAMPKATRSVDKSLLRQSQEEASKRKLTTGTCNTHRRTFSLSRVSSLIDQEFEEDACDGSVYSKDHLLLTSEEHDDEDLTLEELLGNGFFLTCANILDTFVPSRSGSANSSSGSEEAETNNMQPPKPPLHLEGLPRGCEWIPEIERANSIRSMNSVGTKMVDNRDQ